MMPKSLKFLAAAVTASLLATMAYSPASAGGSYGGGGSGPSCHHGGGGGHGGITIYKPVTINTNINIYKPVTINTDINITKNIDIEKNVTINKSIVINKGSAEASASASAEAAAGAFARAGASSGAVSGGGSYVEDTVVNRNAEMGTVNTSQGCDMQEATVVKAIHAVCMSADGHEFPASHMVAETWIDASYEGEIARCIPGSTIKIVIGDV
ncbi:MAG: hypothetical protein ABSC92_12920, partial [Rhizomicrobium sp.]